MSRHEGPGCRARPAVVTAAEAVAHIPDGATIGTDGFTMMGVAEEILATLESRFLQTGRPSALTVVHAAGQSNRRDGFEHFAVEGLVKRIVGSHWGLMPRMSEFLGNNRAEAICLPQGQIAALYRTIAPGRPGHLSTIGLGTFVAPALGGGKMNSRARQSSPGYVSQLTVDGEQLLYYRSFPIDVAIIRATEDDEDGNCAQFEEAVWLDTLSIAQAAHNSGGIVICQAKRMVPRGSIPPRQVTVPGCIVDYVVPATDPERYHRQTDSSVLDEQYLRSSPSSPSSPPSAGELPPFGPKTVIGRRSALLTSPGNVVNLGTGIPGDNVGPAIRELGLCGGVLLTLESGVYGGAPAGGTDFGISSGAHAIIPQSLQFDFYNGGGLDLAFMGMGEVGANGDVHVSSLGGRIIGCGGFIDITQSAKTVVFCFVFDGKFPKFVPAVGEITFSARQAARNKQDVWYVSDRAVFRLAGSGLTLVETAPGESVDAILSAIPFRVAVSPSLRPMPAAIFEPILTSGNSAIVASGSRK
jgi:propionate CoA-transferase